MKWRRYALDDDGARVAFSRNLISAAIGRGGQLTWLWGRNSYGVGLSQSCTPVRDAQGQPASFAEPACDKQAAWFALSLLQSPRALFAHVRSTLLAQANAAAFARLGAARPRVWLLHSRHSARLSKGQAQVTIAVVEALTFLGATFGFVDADEHGLAARIGAAPRADSRGGPLPDGTRMRRRDWLLIPAVSHVDAAALDAIAARLADPGLRARTLGVAAATPHDAILTYGPHGRRWPAPRSSLAGQADFGAAVGGGEGGGAGVFVSISESKGGRPGGGELFF